MYPCTTSSCNHASMEHADGGLVWRLMRGFMPVTAHVTSMRMPMRHRAPASAMTHVHTADGIVHDIIIIFTLRMPCDSSTRNILRSMLVLDYCMVRFGLLPSLHALGSVRPSSTRHITCAHNSPWPCCMQLLPSGVCVLRLEPVLVNMNGSTGGLAGSDSHSPLARGERRCLHGGSRRGSRSRVHHSHNGGRRHGVRRNQQRLVRRRGGGVDQLGSLLARRVAR